MLVLWEMLTMIFKEMANNEIIHKKQVVKHKFLQFLYLLNSEIMGMTCFFASFFYKHRLSRSLNLSCEELNKFGIKYLANIFLWYD